MAIEWALELDEDENLCLFFPDAGAAALARREWKLNDPDEALVPPVSNNNYIITKARSTAPPPA